MQLRVCCKCCCCCCRCIGAAKLQLCSDLYQFRLSCLWRINTLKIAILFIYRLFSFLPGKLLLLPLLMIFPMRIYRYQLINVRVWSVCECERCNTFFICHFGLFLRLFGHFTFAATTSSSRRQKVPPSHRKKQNPQRHRRCGINFRFSLGFFFSFTLPERERAMYHVTSVSRAAAESKKAIKL